MRRLLTSIDLSQHIEESRQALNRILNPPKRQPIVKLRKERQGVFEGLWKWKCRQRSNTWGTSGIWEYVINDAHTHAIMKHALPEYLATRHARNHHGENR